MKTVQQLSTHPARTAGWHAFACAAATGAAGRIVFASQLQGFERSYSDPRRHPGQQDV